MDEVKPIRTPFVIEEGVGARTMGGESVVAQLDLDSGLRADPKHRLASTES